MLFPKCLLHFVKVWKIWVSWHYSCSIWQKVQHERLIAGLLLVLVGCDDIDFQRSVELFFLIYPMLWHWSWVNLHQASCIELSHFLVWANGDSGMDPAHGFVWQGRHRVWWGRARRLARSLCSTGEGVKRQNLSEQRSGFALRDPLGSTSGKLPLAFLF